MVLSQQKLVQRTDFDVKTGKPNKNITDDSDPTTDINSFFMNVQSNLFENKNINDNFIYKYPKVLEVDTLRDIQVTGETTIDVVFIMSGASMKNMFGYYMYYIDEAGNKIILANDPNKDTKYHYSPTVIYPYVYSVENDKNTLQCGNKRRLVGNMSNGNFSNVYIGFFLIPHGWYAFIMNSEIYDHNILYSTINFNKSYVPSEYQMVDDLIYSIFARVTDQKDNDLLFVAFEDIFVDGTYDLDYNDCVVGIIASDKSNIVDYDEYSKVDIENDEDSDNEEDNTFDSNTIIGIDDDGEYIQLNNDKYIISGNYYFERHLCFDNKDDRDATYDVCISLLTNYKYDIKKEDDSNKTTYYVIMSYLFRVNDIKKLKDSDENRKLYLFESKHSTHIKDIVEKYKAVTIKNLKNPNYYEKYKFWDANTNETIIKLTDTINLPHKKGKNFRIIGNGVMDCVNGKSHLPTKNSQIYMVYKNMSKSNGLVVNIKMHTHPTEYMSKSKNFVRYVSFIANTTEHVVIDLGDLSLYQEIKNELVSNETPTYTNIKISEIMTKADSQIKLLISVFKNNSGASYRKVTINDSMDFYCIRFSNIKNNPTMIFLDASLLLEWNDKYNDFSGTYFNKQRIYPVSNFVSTSGFQSENRSD